MSRYHGIKVKGGNDKYAQPKSEVDFLKAGGGYIPRAATIKPLPTLTDEDIQTLKSYIAAINHNAEGAVLVLRWQRKPKSGLIELTSETIQQSNKNVLIGTIVKTTDSEVPYIPGDIGVFSPYGPFSHIPKYEFVQYLHRDDILSFFNRKDKEVLESIYDEWQEPLEYEKLL